MTAHAEQDFHILSEALITLTTLRQTSGESELDSVAVKELLRGLLKDTQGQRGRQCLVQALPS